VLDWRDETAHGRRELAAQLQRLGLNGAGCPRVLHGKDWGRLPALRVNAEVRVEPSSSVLIAGPGGREDGRSEAGLFGLMDSMISISSGNSLLSYLTAETTGAADGGTASSTASANAKARVAATAQAALQAAGSSHQTSVAGRALDKQQTALAVFSFSAGPELSGRARDQGLTAGHSELHICSGRAEVNQNL